MALYAIGEGDLINACDAERGAVYRCLECFGPVKARRGRHRFPHFYHLKTSPSCRLYSKSEDHLLLQLQIQKNYPPGEVEIEKPILSIHRVADLLWEKKKIVFEIQCSLLHETEAVARIGEYKTAGYEVIWVLDDRVFNKKSLRPAEHFLRTRSTYFASVHRTSPSYFYDQFEIFYQGKRLRKGRENRIDLQTIAPAPPIQWPANLPKQIEKRIPNCPWYFAGDLIDVVALSQKSLPLKNVLAKWRAIEERLEQSLQGPNRLKKLWIKLFRNPYFAFLNNILKRLD